MKDYENIKKEEAEDFSKSEKGKVGDMWIPLFTTLLTMNNQPNIELERKVAYLQGKVDTLEAILTERTL